MSLPPNEVFTAFSFVGFLMCAIPFYWHFQARNVGTCLYMAWTGLGCLIRCINSIVWNKNMINRAPVYCDISSRVQVALSSAIPACALCIQRRLYKCTTMTTGGATREEKRRDVVVDLLIGIGIPILQIVAHHVVSERRYFIYEDIGPEHHAVDTPAAYPLYFVWPVAIGTVSFFYSVMNIYHLYRIKRQFKDMPVISSGSGINRSLYIRLMLLSSVEILGTIPLGSFWIYYEIKLGLTKWGSWADIHSNYSKIVQVPSIIWKQSSVSELPRWTLVLCAFLFFAFFGLAEEARKHYRLVYTSLANRLGYSTSSNTTCSSNGAPNSSHLTNRATGRIVFAATPGPRRDSAISYSDQLSIQSTRIADDLRSESKSGKYPDSSIVSVTDGPQGESCQSPIASSSLEIMTSTIA